MIYLTNINLNQNELQNAVIQPLATAPATGKLGQIYCNSTTSKIMYYNGTEWTTVGVVVESSEANGKIKVDGVEMTVYTLPAASSEALGGVKLGQGFEIDGRGNLARKIYTYTGVRTSGQSDTQAIAAIVGDDGRNPLEGDLCIVRTLVKGDTYTQMAFEYANGGWFALDGNVDATNVILTKDITITAPIGVHSIPSSGSKTLTSQGMNVQAFFEYLGAEEKNPTKTNPAVTVNFPQAGSKEVGTTVTPSYTATLSAGSYTYGPATGITAKSWEVTDSNSGSASTANGSFTAFTVADDTHYTITAKATYDAGATPVTNLGNPYPAGVIAAGSATKTSGAVTGFRKYFYGSKTAPVTLNSDNIRGLTNSTSAVGSSKTFDMPVVEGANQVIIAFPTATGKTLSKVLDQGAFGTDIVANFVKSTVPVEGAGGYTAVNYDVYVYSPDAALGANTYKVTIA